MGPRERKLLRQADSCRLALLPVRLCTADEINTAQNNPADAHAKARGRGSIKQ